MKKNRNNFFSQYGVVSMNTNPFMNNQPILDNKLLNLEKRVQELESRVYNLEMADKVPTNTNYNNSMYMI